MKKLLLGTVLGLSLLTGELGATMANAVEFNAQGEWYFGFGGVNSNFQTKSKEGNDTFKAEQRIRLYLDATLSETLSATISFQIGETVWGQTDTGGDLGTDAANIGVRDAYLDWFLPDTNLMFRMGLQGVSTPNVAGGSAIIDEQVAAIVASYKVNDNVGVTAFWLRPFNDNYTALDDAGVAIPNADPVNYLDNTDYFGLSVPITTNDLEITPWAMVGFVGKNAENSFFKPVNDGDPNGSKAYGMQYFAGIPLIFSGFIPFNIELDLNYGYSESMGRYDQDNARDAVMRRANTAQQGWLIKSLVEYKLDWGTPGLIAWYASGDDGNVKNGSERLPVIAPSSCFTSFMQDGDGYSIDGGYDLMLEYGGTWGLGAQLTNISFMEDISHSIRAVYWGGTNSNSMMKYMNEWNDTDNSFIYLTTNDHLIEFNFDTSISIYENLTAIVELGYIINGVDQNAWEKNGAANAKKQDAWKTSLLMKYEF